MQDTKYARGAEWRQWDLHVHTPASYHWNGPRFDADVTAKANEALVDQMIAAMNAAAPDVFALMDYWSFDGWFALKRRLAQPGAPTLTKVVFPGIELRLAAPKCRLNAHVIFSNLASDQTLQDFKSGLELALSGRRLSNEALIEWARASTEDKLNVHGFKKIEVDADDALALRAGAMTAELDCESYKKSIRKVPDGLAVGFMPYDTHDGLEQVQWKDHYTYFIDLFQSSPIFECRDEDKCGAFVGERTPGNEKWLAKFQKALGDVPRLAVSGSDAHRFVGVKNDNNKRGYGDFPSGRATWIKADPTFLGLLQAIKEPARRSYIGACPPKLMEVEGNKTFYIDRVAIQRLATKAKVGKWLDGCSLLLNPDLVAIIGNKGSGKSALADVIALLGNSRQKLHFSFLKRDRFLGKSGEPARQFVGQLHWRDKSHAECNLADDPSPDAVEMVRYIPQGHFEELCNAHVSGRSDAFERELRGVIFDHADESIRLGALDFDQLIEQQEISFRDQLGELRKDLAKVNLQIASIEEQLNPTVKRSLKELLTQKQKQIDEHKKAPPPEVKKPSETLTPEQQAVVGDLEKIANELAQLEGRATQHAASSTSIARKQKAVQNLKERLRLLERAYSQFTEDLAKDFESLGLSPKNLAELKVYPQPLDKVAQNLPEERKQLEAAMAKDSEIKAALLAKQAERKAKLDAPQLAYQAYLKLLGDWTAKLAELIGSPKSPETLEGLRARVEQVEKLPDELKLTKKRRLELSGQIFDVLEDLRQARASLFKPVQDLIQANALIREFYKLQFQATLGGSADSIANSLFVLVKQNSGEFRGPDESIAAVKGIADEYDFSVRTGILGFVTALVERIEVASKGDEPQNVGVANALRKEKTANEVYDLLFGLSFLVPRYSLLFQDTQIEQLSPGQRGALLLIFYLLVDKGRNPIILDQPEENLDNETVVSLLVPVLSEAKRKRQIIMVTHNPNLAVYCDAEQVIHSTFNRKGSCAISYTSGSIEFPPINKHVVNVLEGTKDAFDNRGRKYL